VTGTGGGRPGPGSGCLVAQPASSEMPAATSIARAGNRERAGSTSLWVNIADLTIERDVGHAVA
jgi:hypothetical protein